MSVVGLPLGGPRRCGMRLGRNPNGGRIQRRRMDDHQDAEPRPGAQGQSDEQVRRRSGRRRLRAALVLRNRVFRRDHRGRRRLERRSRRGGRNGQGRLRELPQRKLVVHGHAQQPEQRLARRRLHAAQRAVARQRRFLRLLRLGRKAGLALGPGVREPREQGQHRRQPPGVRPLALRKLPGGVRRHLRRTARPGARSLRIRTPIASRLRASRNRNPRIPTEPGK